MKRPMDDTVDRGRDVANVTVDILSGCGSLTSTLPPRPPAPPRLAPALHIAYLSRNFKVASELLEHGASDTLRDEIGKTAPQMLKQNKPVRRRFALVGRQPVVFAACSFSGVKTACPCVGTS